MAHSSKISRRGIAPLDIDLSRAVFNIKRRVMFTIDDQPRTSTTSSGAISANAAADNSICSFPSHPTLPETICGASAKKSLHSGMISAKSSPPPVEILYNPYNTETRQSDSSSANATEIHIDDCVVSIEEKAKDPFTQLVNTVSEGLRYHPPELCDEGENGTYFLRDRDGNRVAVFKSADEEGISSPKRKSTPSLLVENPEDDEYFKQFHLEIAGENDQHSLDMSPDMERQITDCIRNEVAPFVLDLQANRFYSVPQTGLVAIHPHASVSKKMDSKKKISGNYFATTKVGSLQEFVDSDGTASDVGPVLFPVKEVHKIGILDLQILNLDRHLGNLLIKKNRAGSPSDVPPRPTTSPHLAFGDRRQTISGVSFFSSGQGPTPAKYESDPSSLPSSWPRSVKSLLGEFVLIPIDHGYSLPSSFASVKDLWFEWITFPQAKRPFDEETKQFIEAIDIETNVCLFQELGICEDSIKIMEVTTTLLKKCAKANWTLYDIAMLLVNSSLRDDDEPSALEDLIEEAEEDYLLLLSNGDRPLSPSSNTRLFINLISQKIDDLIQQHQQMLLTQQQFERN